MYDTQCTTTLSGEMDYNAIIHGWPCALAIIFIL